MIVTPKDIVLNAWKTFSSRDADRIAALFTPDAEWIAPKDNATAVALDHADHMIGPAQIARFIAREMLRMFCDISIEFRGVYADGNTVIVEERMRATLPGGEPYENDYCFVFTVKNERIAQVREYMDTRKGWRMVFGDGDPTNGKAAPGGGHSSLKAVTQSNATSRNASPGLKK